MKSFDKAAILPLGRRVLAIEADAVSALQERIDDTFVHACQICLDCEGRIVVTGIGATGMMDDLRLVKVRNVSFC